MLSSLFWRSAEQPASHVSDHDHGDAEQLLTPRGWNPGVFDADHSVRVLMCYDSSVRGKCPLLDTHVRLHRPASPPITALSNGAPSPSGGGASAGAGTKRPSPRKVPANAMYSADLKLIGEMMFGVLPMTYRGITSKIHYLRFPSELLITKMFSFTTSDFHFPGQPLSMPVGAHGTSTPDIKAPRTPPPAPPPSQAGSLLNEGPAQQQLLQLSSDDGLTGALPDLVSPSLAWPPRGPGRASPTGATPSSAVASGTPTSLQQRTPTRTIGPRPRSNTILAGSLSPDDSLASTPLATSQPLSSIDSSPLIEFGNNRTADDATGPTGYPSYQATTATATATTATIGGTDGRRSRATSNASDLLFTAPPSSSAASTASQTYSARRYLRHRSTSIEHGMFIPSPLPTAVSSVFSNDRTLSFTTSPHQQHLLQEQQNRHRRLQFAVGVVINVGNNRILRDLLFSHFALIEFRLHKMHDRIAEIIRDAVRAGLPPHLLQQPNPSVTVDDIQQLLTPYVYQMNEAMMEQVNEFRDCLRALYYVPRIHEPLWLNLVAFPNRRTTICKLLIQQFGALLDSATDTRRSIHFLGSVLTSVLSYHLAWVPTVAPPPPASDNTFVDSFDNTHAPSTTINNANAAIGRFFPYNPLWAQLCDLYGAIGTPAQLARTIVVGQNVGLVNRLLLILTYFIRCSEVFESLEQLEVHARARVAEKRYPEDERDSGNYSNDIDCSGGFGPNPRHQHNVHTAHFEDDFGSSPAQAVDLVTLLDTFRMGEDATSKGSPPTVLSPGSTFTAQSTTTGPGLIRTLSNLSQSPQNHANGTSVNSISDDMRSRGSSRTFGPDEAMTRPRQNSHPEDTRPMSNSSSVYGTSPVARAPSPFATLPGRASFVPGPSQMEAHRTAFEAILGDEKVEGLCEIAMPSTQAVRIFPNVLAAPSTGVPRYRSEQMFCKTYGRSLLGGYCQRYAPDFVLLGVPTLNFMEQLVEDLTLSVKHGILDEPVNRAVCIIADMDEWRCELITSSTDEVVAIDPVTLAPRRTGSDGTYGNVSITQRQPQPSDFVMSTLQSLKGLLEMRLSPETCVMFLEDRLQELYFKSVLLSEYVNEHVSETLTYRSVATKLGLPLSDMPLLVAVASTHHSNIAQRFKISEHLFGVMHWPQ